MNRVEGNRLEPISTCVSRRIPFGWLKPPRAYLTLFVLALIFRLATAVPIERAGYMDASYTLHIAANLAQGRGFVEEVLWNYLDAPRGLPHPSNLYWLPLPAMLAAPFVALFGGAYHAAQIPFVLLSALVPLVAFWLSWKMFERVDFAWASALLVLFSGFYTVYWVSPDNFTPFALTTSLALILIARGLQTRRGRDFFGAGLLIGLSHLARADGALVLGVVVVALAISKFEIRNSKFIIRNVSVCLLGYLLVMLPWFARNVNVISSPLPAGLQTVYLTNYDEFFRFAASDLTPARYLAWGAGNILQSKLNAAGFNLLVLLFGDLQIFLTPFALVGLCQLRRRMGFLPFFLYLAILYFTLTLIFTFPSTHGLMLHSSLALLPFFAVAVPPGVEAVVGWIAARRRGWQAQAAKKFFLWSFVGLAAVVSVFLYAQGVFFSIGTPTIARWNERDREYQDLARELNTRAADADVVMVVDPPSFYNAAHRRAIMIPTESTDALFLAAQKYGARWLVLQFDHPRTLSDLYHQRATVPGLTLVATFQDALKRPVFLYQFER